MGESPGKLAEPGQAGFINNRGNGMAIPVDALIVIDASEIPAGNFFLLDGKWFLSVKSTNVASTKTCSVQLTGGTAGAFAGLSSGEATYFSNGYRIEARVEGLDGTVSGNAEPWYATLILGSKPVIMCATETGPRFYYLDGSRTDGSGNADNSPRFKEWSGWLIGPDGNPVGTEPVFKVSAV